VHDVAAALQAARERAGLTLDEISSRTKIKVAFLQAIERGDFAQLPGRFFTRAFLRTYAREVHLPPDEIVAAYDEVTAPVQADSAGQAQPATTRARDVILDDSRSPLFAATSSLWPTLGVALAAILLVMLMTRTGTAPEEPDAQPVGTAGIADAATPPAPAPAAPAEKLTISIRPSRVLWVAGMADGRRAIYRLVEPGELVRIDARDDLWFRVGDAGAFVYSINGAPEKPLGAPGEVREFRITRDNYRTFGQ
jgi:transcriptional regulator with XRE-family HTH domain